jgi:UDP-N-acetylmuramate dehydrogenase
MGSCGVGNGRGEAIMGLGEQFQKVFEKLQGSFRGELLRNEPMSRHTSWQVGGPADLYLVPADKAALAQAVQILCEANLPYMPLGAGTNLLVRDGGIRGAVLDLGAFASLEMLEKRRIRAGSGLLLSDLIRSAAEHGLAGLEYLYGIPGTVGGAVIMNAGAFHQQFGDVVEKVVWIGPQGEKIWTLDELSFNYRTTGFTREQIVLEVLMKFSAGDPGELTKILRERNDYRVQTHEVSVPTAGSVFRNPPGENAWRLVEEAGMRGVAVGEAQVSEKHTNFIVNRGQARAADILSLINKVRRAVQEKTGILLEPEVKIVGED